MNVQRFPHCSSSEDCVQAQGTDRNYKNCCDLMHAAKQRSVSVALAGKIRGAVNACLDLLLHFCVKTKVEINETMNDPAS